jgi:ATP-dependent helicase/nuclease subunit A
MSATTKVKLTAEQQAALSATDRSVSLAAGAGCGKTFVLTERFLSYLDPRELGPLAELHELVAITFTEAAAREMRDRVRKRCYERLASATDPNEQKAWRRLLRTLDSARISTIHSFCAALLRSHAVEANLDPQFEQLDQASADLLRLRSLDERLRQLLLERDERVIQLATRFGLRQLREHLVALLGENLAPVVIKWRGKSPDDLITVWKKHFQTETRKHIVADFLAAPPVEAVRNLCETAVPASPELSALFDRVLAIMAELPNSSAPSELLGELRELAKATGPGRKKNWADETDYARFQEAAKDLRNLVDKSVLTRPWNEELLQETAQTGLELLELAADVSHFYQLAKQRRNLLEFDDLIQKAQMLLTDPRFAHVQKELAGSTRLLLVDEFQDTDPAQVAIVESFCGEHWQERGLFVVGDFKQSIYRFRGAEPEVSRKLRKSLPDESRLSLTTNFRSQGAILDFVNALFCDSFHGEFEPLHPQRPQLTPLPSVEFLWAFEDQSASDDSIPPQLRGAERQRYLEARFIARRLAELIDSEVPLIVDQSQNTLRPIRPGDVAILLRSLSDVQVYEAALREQGLEYYLAGGHAFYAQQEIYDVLYLLRSIVSAADELSLAGALRSPLFALTDETLFWLVNHSGSLKAALVAESLPDELDDAERAKVIRACSVLVELRAAKDNLLVAELLTKAIELTGYDAVMLTEFLGQRKLANLHKLVEQARTLDRLNPGDVNGFVTQLSEFVTRAPKEPVASTSATGDVVRIMTIHNAKGLEFPLVLIPDLNRKPPPVNRDPVMDERLGPLVPALADEKVCVGWDLYQQAEKVEDQQEILRLLYVACTRAADYLILSSSLKDPHKPASDWLKFLGSRFDLTTGDCLASLPPGYNAPQIRVTTAEPSSSRKEPSRVGGADLAKLIEKTTALADKRQGVMPSGVAAIPVDSQARRRFSFSRLWGTLKAAPAHEIDEDLAGATHLDPLGFGTLVHELLERSAFDGATNVRELCEFLAPQHLEAPTAADIDEATRIVERFMKSGRAADIAAAQCVLQEPEFLLPWPNGGSQRYLHGYIDCLYQDAQGDWHLIDYKSNQVTADGVCGLARTYEMQMFVYALACERALNKRPSEIAVCFLRPGIEHEFSWNESEMAKLSRELDRAIEALITPPSVTA